MKTRPAKRGRFSEWLVNFGKSVGDQVSQTRENRGIRETRERSLSFRVFRGFNVFVTRCFSLGLASRPLRLWLALAPSLLFPALSLHAQLRLLPDQEPQRLFAGEARKVLTTWHNPGDRPLTSNLHTRLFQASSATVIPLGDAPWKKLEVLPGQTVLESASFNFPAVKAETRFLIQWVQGTNQVLGKTEVWLYPPDLLKALKPLLGESLLGFFDPHNQLKPLLKGLEIEVTDLEDSGLEHFSGKLAILGPFPSKTPIRDGFAQDVKALAAKGVAVVWIQLQPERRGELKPPFYTVPEGRGTVVVVEPALIADLSARPQAQLNLIQFARQALHPEPPRLPFLAPSPTDTDSHP